MTSKKLRKLYKKTFKRIRIFIFGKCKVEGHDWKMQHDGWQLNPKWEPEIHGFHNPKFPMTRKWIYHRCKRCGAMGE